MLCQFFPVLIRSSLAQRFPLVDLGNLRIAGQETEWGSRRHAYTVNQRGREDLQDYQTLKKIKTLTTPFCIRQVYCRGCEKGLVLLRLFQARWKTPLRFTVATTRITEGFTHRAAAQQDDQGRTLLGWWVLLLVHKPENLCLLQKKLYKSVGLKSFAIFWGNLEE